MFNISSIDVSIICFLNDTDIKNVNPVILCLFSI